MMTQDELVNAIKCMTPTANDQTAARSIELYPQLTIGMEVTKEMIDCGKNRFRWNGRLYKVPNPIQKILDNWTPDKAPSLYETIDVIHSGTKEDPIEYNLNMVVFKDKYYTHSGRIYLCTRDSEIPLQYTPDQLIDQYFIAA